MPATDLRPTHREQLPARRCVRCRCWMRSYHDSERCDPCEGRPVIESPEDAFERIAEMEDFRARRAAFQELAEVMEAA